MCASVVLKSALLTGVLFVWEGAANMKEFRIIYQILKTLRDATSYSEFDTDFISPETLGINRELWTSIMEMLVEEGYIAGISVKRGAQGDVVLSVSSPRITLKGLEYLNENSLMKKAANIAKGIKEIIPGA